MGRNAKGKDGEKRGGRGSEKEGGTDFIFVGFLIVVCSTQ